MRGVSQPWDTRLARLAAGSAPCEVWRLTVRREPQPDRDVAARDR